MRNRTENQITLVLIRHGATNANREHRYLGKTDEDLSPEGIRELEVYKNREYYPQIDALFTSPMKRCVRTAEIIYPGLESEQVDCWEEIDFGSFEGKNYKELQDDVRYQAWIDSGGRLPFPEGESREEFMARCDRGFLQMLRSVNEINHQKIGMVVHGGTIMALLNIYGGGDYFEYRAENGRGYVCTVKNGDNGPEISGIREI